MSKLRRVAGLGISAALFGTGLFYGATNLLFKGNFNYTLIFRVPDTIIFSFRRSLLRSFAPS